MQECHGAWSSYSSTHNPRQDDTGTSGINLGYRASDFSHEGIFHEHGFRINEEHNELFNVAYSCALAKNVESGEMEAFLCLEQTSKLDGKGLAKHGGRPSMNFSFVLDVSGSMDEKFDYGDSKTKLQIAQECLIALLSTLHPNDKFGLLTFSDTAKTVIPLTRVDQLVKGEVKQKILALQTEGGTTIGEGMFAAEAMLDVPVEGDTNRHNASRIMLLTDMNPTDHSYDIVANGHRLAEQKSMLITVIGIGVDFNIDLADKLAEVKGCCFDSVSSASEFKKQMCDDFDFITMMICFDVSVKMKSTKYDVAEIYGCPTKPNREIGEVLKIGSICPTRMDENGGLKGGVVLLKLTQKDLSTAEDDIVLSVTYKDWHDQQHTIETVVKFPAAANDGANYFQNFAVRKAVALTRYVSTAKTVITNTQAKAEKDEEKSALIETNKAILERFKQYLSDEIRALDDPSMEKQIENLVHMIGVLVQKSSEAATTTTTTTSNTANLG